MPPHIQASEETKLALDAHVKLNRAASSFMTRILAHETLEELTLSQFAVMEAIYHLGPLSQTDISTKVLRSGGNITLVIDNLEKQRLVKRCRNSEDRRVITVELTEAGIEKMARIIPVHIEAIVEEMNVLSLAEQILLAKLCRKLGKRLSDDLL